MALNIQTRNKEMYTKLNMLRTGNRISIKDNKRTHNIINKINKKETRVSIQKNGNMLNISKIRPLNYNIYFRKTNR